MIVSSYHPPRLISSVLFLFLLDYVKAQNATATNITTNVSVSYEPPKWGGCVDPRDETHSVVKKGFNTGLCITVSEGTDWALGIDYARWFFKPIADQYSEFTIENSYNDLVAQENHEFGDLVSIHVASQQGISFIRRFYDKTQDKIYPYLTAILDVEDGIVKGIAWDDSCVFCQNNGRCEENTYDFTGNLTTGNGNTGGCVVTKEECDKLHANGENTCDLKIYFVWTGSDVDGRILSSAGSRWSAFPLQKLPKLDLSSLKNITGSIKDIAGNLANRTGLRF